MIALTAIHPDPRVWMLCAKEGRLWRRALCGAFFYLSFGIGALSAQDLPSGQTVDLYDSLLEIKEPDAPPSLVIRYVAPRIARQGGDLRYDDVAADLDALCNSDGLEALSMAQTAVSQIVIVLMDRPVERGVPAPDATQLISAYVPTDDGCVWQ